MGGLHVQPSLIKRGVAWEQKMSPTAVDKKTVHEQ